MLRRGKDNPVHLWGYLVGVEVEEGGHTSPNNVALRIADSLAFMEDIGKVDVEELGKLDIFPEENI